MPNYANFSFSVGEDFTQPFTIKDATGTNTLNITGWSIALYFQEYPDAGGTTWPILHTYTASLDNPTVGLCSVTFPRADTLTLTPKVYFYKLSRTDTNVDAALVEGYLILVP